MQTEDEIEEALVRSGRTQRSTTLAELYEDLANKTDCGCPGGEHSETDLHCRRAVWEKAAEMARGMIEDDEEEDEE